MMKPPEHYEYGPYSTDRATLLSGDDYHFLGSWERPGGRNEWLYRSDDDGKYFAIRVSTPFDRQKIKVIKMLSKDAWKLYLFHCAAAKIFDSDTIRAQFSGAQLMKGTDHEDKNSNRGGKN